MQDVRIKQSASKLARRLCLFYMRAAFVLWDRMQKGMLWNEQPLALEPHNHALGSGVRVLGWVEVQGIVAPVPPTPEHGCAE